MVSKAIDEGLLSRIQQYVANDLNSRIPPDSTEDRVRPANVYVIRFTRVLGNWEAVAVAHIFPEIFYEISHDGVTDTNIANVFTKRTTQPAII